MSKDCPPVIRPITAALILMIGVLQIPSVMGAPGDILGSYPAPCNSPGDLAWDGTHLWLLDDQTGTLYMLDPQTGTATRELALELAEPRGLASDGTGLWVSDEAGRVIRRLDPGSGEAGPSVPVLGSADGAAPARLGGLAWDGSSLWTGTIDGWSSKLQQCDAATGEVTRWHFSIGYPIALETDGQHLWTATNSAAGDPGRIFQYDYDTGAYVSHFDAPGQEPVGLAYDGTTLWCVDLGLRRIFRLSLE